MSDLRGVLRYGMAEKGSGESVFGSGDEVTEGRAAVKCSGDKKAIVETVCKIDIWGARAI